MSYSFTTLNAPVPAGSYLGIRKLANYLVTINIAGLLGDVYIYNGAMWSLIHSFGVSPVYFDIINGTAYVLFFDGVNYTVSWSTDLINWSTSAPMAGIVPTRTIHDSYISSTDGSGNPIIVWSSGDNSAGNSVARVEKINLTAMTHSSHVFVIDASPNAPRGVVVAPAWDGYPAANAKDTVFVYVGSTAPLGGQGKLYAFDLVTDAAVLLYSDSRPESAVYTVGRINNKLLLGWGSGTLGLFSGGFSLFDLNGAVTESVIFTQGTPNPNYAIPVCINAELSTFNCAWYGAVDAVSNFLSIDPSGSIVQSSILTSTLSSEVNDKKGVSFANSPIFTFNGGGAAFLIGASVSTVVNDGLTRFVPQGIVKDSAGNNVLYSPLQVDNQGRLITAATITAGGASTASTLGNLNITGSYSPSWGIPAGYDAKANNFKITSTLNAAAVTNINGIASADFDLQNGNINFPMPLRKNVDGKIKPLLGPQEFVYTFNNVGNGTLYTPSWIINTGNWQFATVLLKPSYNPAAAYTVAGYFLVSPYANAAVNAPGVSSIDEYVLALNGNAITSSALVFLGQVGPGLINAQSLSVVTAFRLDISNMAGTDNLTLYVQVS